MSIMTGLGFVVMAVYQPDPHLLERQISSLSAQTESHWGCLIGVDGADEEALRLVQRLTRRDTRMEVREYVNNLGVYRHFERLLAEVPADASWVALADQDDVWHPAKLARLTQTLDAPGVTAAMCQARVVTAEGRLLGHTDRRAAKLPAMLLRNQVSGSLAVFEGSTVRRALPFPTGDGEAIHDHWLAVCAAAMGEVRLCDERLQDYVQHSANVLGEARPTSLRDVFQGVRRHGGLRPYLDQLAEARWGWRVSIARSLQDGRFTTEVGDPRFVRAIAEGRLLSTTVVWTVFTTWWDGRLRARAGASVLVSAGWLAVGKRSS